MMNVRILGSVLMIAAALVFFLFYTETGRLLVTAAGFGGLLR
jgi:hypothetical protein